MHGERRSPRTSSLSLSNACASVSVFSFSKETAWLAQKSLTTPAARPCLGARLHLPQPLLKEVLDHGHDPELDELGKFVGLG